MRRSWRRRISSWLYGDDQDRARAATDNGLGDGAQEGRRQSRLAMRADADDIGLEALRRVADRLGGMAMRDDFHLGMKTGPGSLGGNQFAQPGETLVQPIHGLNV